MNKKIVGGLCIVLIIVAGAYFAFAQKKETPPPAPEARLVVTSTPEPTEPDPSVPVVAKPKTPSAATQPTNPNWKVFSGGGVSLTAPSAFIMNAMPSEDLNILMVGVGGDDVGVISIYKFSNKEIYQREMVEGRPATGQTGTDYMIGKVPGTLYVGKDGEDGTYTISLIDVPARNAMIMLTPSPKEWPTVSESDVNKIIQSIKF